MRRYRQLVAWTVAAVQGGPNRPLAAKVVLALPAAALLVAGVVLVLLPTQLVRAFGKGLDQADANFDARIGYERGIATGGRESRLGLDRNTPRRD